MTDALKRVFCLVDDEDKHDAIDRVIASCTIFNELPDKERFVRAVHRRERVQSTGIGHGVAIAHGKVPDISSVYIALGFSEKGIIFDERYPDPVKLVFVIASPLHKEADYLKAVASILTWVHDPEFRTKLVGKMWDDDTVSSFMKMLENQAFKAQYEK